MTKYHRMFAIIFSFVLVFLFIVFSHIIYKPEKKMLADLNVLLEDLLTEAERINFENKLAKIDSIYDKGNQIIKISNLSNMHAEYVKFNQIFGEHQFEIVDKNRYDIITQVKIIQIFAIKNTLKCFYQSHFQSERIGLFVLSPTIKCNKRDTIEFFPYTMSREIKPPIVIIDNDTVSRSNDYTYEFSIIKTVPGTHLLKGEIIIEKWGETYSYPADVYLNVVK